MTDAFQCEQCGEYNEGSGKRLRVGEYKPEGTLKNYLSEIDTELCEDCYTGALDLVREYVGEDGGRP